MERLTELSSKEASGEQSLDGSYRVVVDINVEADKNWTLDDIRERLYNLGDVQDIHIEKHSSIGSSEGFSAGDTIVLSDEYSCRKPVYLDTSGNLVITDKPVARSVECVGTFAISLPEGTLAEVNQEVSDEDIEVLFTGASIAVEGLDKIAYLGILSLPNQLVKRFDV